MNPSIKEVRDLSVLAFGLDNCCLVGGSDW